MSPRTFVPALLPAALLALASLTAPYAQEQQPESITTQVEDNGYGAAPSADAPAPQNMRAHYGDATTDTFHNPDASGYTGGANYPAHAPGFTPPTVFTGLATTSGWAVGLQGSAYQYEEPDLGVKIKGGTIGGEVDGTLRLLGPVWARAEVGGWVAPDQDYTGSTFGGSTLTGKKTDYKGDARLLVGTDLEFIDGPLGRPFVIAPFAGYGLRDLYDTAGSYDQPAAGYRRNNFLQYLALGGDLRLPVFAQIPLEWRNEYDYMTSGRQTSYFSDAGGADVTTSQHNGWAYRTHLAVLTRLADLGVYYQHWSVDASSPGFAGAAIGEIYEPANRTNEVGIFLRHRF